VMHPMKLTLEEIFNGKQTKIAVNRERICGKCDGKGGKEGAVQKCRGKGEVIDEANKCKTCNGKKVVKEKKIIEVDIDKGTPDKYEYKFHGEADEYPGMEAGDVIIVC